MLACLALSPVASTPERNLILVLSEQRSGSTWLAHAISRAFGCGAAVGEPMLARASSGGFQRFQWHKGLDPPSVKLRRKVPLVFLRDVRNNVCQAMRNERWDCESKPDAPLVQCAVVLKLFRTHGLGVGAEAELRELLNDPATLSVILRRDPNDAECSRRFAASQHDWALTPGMRKPAQLAAFEAFRLKNCTSTLVDWALRKLQLRSAPEHETAHASWFGLLERLAPPAQTVHVSFTEATQDTAATVARVIKAAGLPTWGGDVPPPCKMAISECAMTELRPNEHPKRKANETRVRPGWHKCKKGCCRHEDCEGLSWCSDTQSCSPCSAWDPRDVSASFTGKTPPKCRESMW